MLERLRAQGKLRRERDPDPNLILHLTELEMPFLVCPECSQGGLTWEQVRDDFDDWGDARRCQLCREPIPPERLEIFPDSVRCAKCQDRSDPAQADDFCPRCGGLLRVQARGGAGLARYASVCPDCGYRS